MAILRRRPAAPAPAPAPARASNSTLPWKRGDRCAHPKSGNSIIDAFANMNGVWQAFTISDSGYRNTCRVDELLPPLEGKVRRRRR